MKYWLMKSEPNEFGIEDLIQKKDQTEPWDGVRNYQARNMMRDEMQVGDQVFFYHSNCETPGIVGIMQIERNGYPDFTSWDSENKHYDPKSTPEQPRWYMVDVKFVKKFKRTISLSELKNYIELENLPLVRKGNRLSVMPVSKEEWNFILTLE